MRPKVSLRSGQYHRCKTFQDLLSVYGGQIAAYSTIRWINGLSQCMHKYLKRRAQNWRAVIETIAGTCNSCGLSRFVFALWLKRFCHRLSDIVQQRLFKQDSDHKRIYGVMKQITYAQWSNYVRAGGPKMVATRHQNILAHYLYSQQEYLYLTQNTIIEVHIYMRQAHNYFEVSYVRNWPDCSNMTLTAVDFSGETPRNLFCPCMKVPVWCPRCHWSRNI